MFQHLARVAVAPFGCLPSTRRARIPPGEDLGGVRRREITVTLALPAMLNFMLSTYNKDSYDISHLR